MKVNVYPADLGGCGHYRMIWPAEALAAQGADVTVIRPTEPDERQVQATWWTDDAGVSTLVDVRAPEADVVVLQRPLTDTLTQSIPMLQAKGIRVVVEIDDDFETISRRNISWRAVHPASSPRRNWQHLREACRVADWVVVSTPALAARYGRHGRVSVVPNCVPSRYLGVEAEPHDGVVVGWTGTVQTHPDDLQVTRGAVGRALRAAGASFAVVGTGKGVRDRLGLAEPPLAAGWVPIERYPEAVAQFDVGIVPLELTAFNEAKSWLKGLEMAALGVPFVASPTGPYRELAREGAGLCASKPREWEAVLRRLAGDVTWQAAMADVGRDVARRWTIEGNCERWLEAWGQAVNTPCAA